MENQWSKELIEYTRNHFGDLGTTRLKNLKPGYYAAGNDTNLYIPDEVEERVPEEIKGKQYILFIKSPTGFHFESFDSIDEIIAEGWAIN